MEKKPNKNKKLFIDGNQFAKIMAIMNALPLIDYDQNAIIFSNRTDLFTPYQLRVFWETQLATSQVSPDYPLGLYLHIPFCEKICKFCRCYYQPLGKDPTMLDQYTQFIVDQIEYFYPTFSSIPIKYFSIGGGTPSVLSSYQLNTILEKLHHRFIIDGKNPLNTIEMTFNTINQEKLNLLSNFGISRVSVGIQTLDMEVRKKLNMLPLDIDEVQRKLSYIRDSNLYSNIDLIIGLPGVSPNGFSAGFKNTIDLHPDSVFTNILMDNFFNTVESNFHPDDTENIINSYINEISESILASAHEAQYQIHPRTFPIDEIGFFSSDYENIIQPYWEIIRRLSAGVNSINIGTPVLAFGTFCNQVVPPNFQVGCFTRDYIFDSKKVMYQISSHGVMRSILNSKNGSI